MSIIEIIAVIFSLLSVIYSIKNNALTWPTGIIGIIFYAILFYQSNIFGNMCLQSVFLIQSIIGWYKWNKKGEEINIKWLTKHDRVNYILSTLSLTTLLYFLLDKSPILDVITTSLSIIAITLLSFRKIESWIYWIIVDILYIIFFINEKLYLSALVYFVFLLLAISGLKEWIKKLNKIK